MPDPAVGGARLPAVVARSVSKSFTVPEEKVHTLKERALHPRRKIRSTTFSALNDVSFAVARGEFFGIAGRNGSGKSTLLKCLAGIYRTDGDIWVRGRLSTMIELGVGFNMDMAARDNVVMNGIMLGLSPREARKRYESVIEFAELEEFKDLKLKNYSSGMQVRLAFSVAIQVDAEILMIDEVLAVGDARVLSVWLEDEAGEELTSAPQHQPITIKARVRFMSEVLDPSSGMIIYNEEHRPITIATTAFDHERSGSFRAGEEVVFSFHFENVLAPGRYSPVIEVAHRGSGLDVIDRFESSFSFVTTGSLALGGMIDLPVRSGVTRITRIDAPDSEHSGV